MKENSGKEKRKRKRPTGRGARTRPILEEEELIMAKTKVEMVDGKIILRDLAAEDLETRESRLLKMEWALSADGLVPQSWLKQKRLMEENRAEKIIARSGGAASWYAEKEKIKDQVVKTITKRHVDLVVEVQESHIAGSKLTLAKAMDMLANGTEKYDRETKTNVRVPLRSVDLLNCATALEKAQNIYRKAIGLGNEEGGLKQILEAIQHANGMTQINIQNNTTIEAAEDLPPEELAMREKMQKMSYEDLVEIIEWRREQKRRREEEQKTKPSDKKE